MWPKKKLLQMMRITTFKRTENSVFEKIIFFDKILKISIFDRLSYFNQKTISFYRNYRFWRVFFQIYVFNSHENDSELFLEWFTIEKNELGCVYLLRFFAFCVFASYLSFHHNFLLELENLLILVSLESSNYNLSNDIKTMG